MLQCTMHYEGLNDNVQGKPLKEFHKYYLRENSTHACVWLYSCMCAVTYYRTGINYTVKFYHTSYDHETKGWKGMM